MQVFEGNSPPGHIKIDSVLKALTTYGSEQLTEEQAHDLVSQVNRSASTERITIGARRWCYQMFSPCTCRCIRALAKNG